LTPYGTFQVGFHLKAQSMELGESFLVEMWNGTTWVVVATYASRRGLHEQHGPADSSTTSS
jgi:hypothetical protein